MNLNLIVKLKQYCKHYLYNTINRPSKPETENNVVNLLDQAAKKHSRKNSEDVKFDNLANNTNEEIVDMIDNILKNFKTLSEKRDWFSAYYQNLADIVNIKEDINLFNNIKANKPYFPENKQNFTKLKTKFLEKDSPLPSPIVTQEKHFDEKASESRVKTQEIKKTDDDQVKILDDDQFDHDM